MIPQVLNSIKDTVFAVDVVTAVAFVVYNKTNCTTLLSGSLNTLHPFPISLNFLPPPNIHSIST